VCFGWFDSFLSRGTLARSKDQICLVFDQINLVKGPNKPGL
jgi:hypothetical protein